jgi:hypothetical protein
MENFQKLNISANPQRLALTSPTSCGRSVGIVRLRTTATEFSLYSMSRTSNQYFVSMYRVYYVNTDNILKRICEV